MPTRRLPVCPNLDQLKHQDKDLIRALHSGDPAALAELQEHHPIPYRNRRRSSPTRS